MRAMMQFSIRRLENLKNVSPSIGDGDRNETKNCIFIFLMTGKRGKKK